MTKPTIYRWSPTTCDCEIYEYMDENGVMSYVTPDEAEQLVAEIYAKYPESTKHPSEWRIRKRSTKACAAHAGLADGAELGGVIAEEDRRKSLVLRTLLGLDGIDLGLHEATVDAEGRAAVTFKSGVTPDVAFVGSGRDRVLTVAIRGAALSRDQRTAAQTTCNTRFGSGKVVVE